jgi:NADPH2:quinone reductase
MRAVVGRELGPPERYAIEEIDAGACGPDEIVVAIRYAGVSLVDCLIAAGKYQVKPDLPFTPGSEFSGVVSAVGCNVSDYAPGDRVAGSALGGAFAEAIRLPAGRVHRLPDAADFAIGAIYRVSYATAYNALVRRAALRSGETVLVLGASGAVGAASIQVAKALGATVIASASGEAKRAFALAQGADSVIEARGDDWRDRLKAVTDGVDVVVDPVGGAATEPAFRSLRWGGRHVIVGFAAGAIPKLPVNLPLLKGGSLMGTDLRQFGEREPEAYRADVAAVWELFGRGLTRPAIAAIYTLDSFADAMRAVMAGEAGGRILLGIGTERE